MSDKRKRKTEVMGIVNLTDDSFFEGSRFLGKDGSLNMEILLARIDSMVSEGAAIIDLGACSTRRGRMEKAMSGPETPCE